MSNLLKNIASTAIALALGFALALSVAALAGESPFHVLKILWNSAFGSAYDLGVTLYYATPMILCGLSVAIAFHAGLFNIGAEGQLTLGALAAAATGALLPDLPAGIAPAAAILAAFLAGGIWGAIPGWLRAYRASHEVINTIMMNFIAAGIASYITTALLQNPNSQNPETRDMGTHFFIRSVDPIAKIFGDAPVSSGFMLAVVAAIFLWFFLQRSSLGFEIRATGTNEVAARTAGIEAKRARVLAMFLAGAIAGLVAYGEVLGSAERFRLGFSADYGFIGIAVALLARNNPLAIIFTGVLFGALHKGAADLDIETDKITRDLSIVIQALVILSVSLTPLFPAWAKFLRRKK